MESNDIVTKLVRDLKPTRRLADPGSRLWIWLGVSLLYAGAVIAYMGPRSDLNFKLAEPIFLFEIAAPLLTGILAAYGALSSGVPGRPFWERIAPLPAAVAWIATIGGSCWLSFTRVGSGALTIHLDPICFPAIVLAGLVPAILLIVMVRRGVPLYPTMTMALTMLAAAAFGAAILRLFHTQDASIMILVWQIGTVALLMLLGAAAGRRTISWQSA